MSDAHQLAVSESTIRYVRATRASSKLSQIQHMAGAAGHGQTISYAQLTAASSSMSRIELLRPLPLDLLPQPCVPE